MLIDKISIIIYLKFYFFDISMFYFLFRSRLKLFKVFLKNRISQEREKIVKGHGHLEIIEKKEKGDQDYKRIYLEIKKKSIFLNFIENILK